MKNRVALLLGLALIDLPVAAQNGVFKCTDSAGVIVYQGSPCVAQQTQVTLVEPRKREPEPVTPIPATTQPQTESVQNRSVLAGNELIPGMSDTKVLNMRGWGRPQHIARNRAEDGWREEWTYVSRADGATRLVQFVNGKVAGVRSQDTQQLARIEQQRRIESQQIVQASRGPQTQAFDPAARADEAAQTAQRLVRTETPPSVAIRWESAAARDASGAQSFPAPVEPSAAARQIERAQVEPPVTLVQPAPNDGATRPEPLYVIRNEPPLAGAAHPEAVVQSSAHPQFAVGGEQPVTQ